jgi:hypothetical protein
MKTSLICKWGFAIFPKKMNCLSILRMSRLVACSGYCMCFLTQISCLGRLIAWVDYLD